MNENEYLAGIVRQQLEAGAALVLVSIMSLQGSTPRHSGTKMVVGADGKGYGTIGGSLIEAAAVRESVEVLATGQSRIMYYELTGKDAAATGMICGGKAEVLLDYLPATGENKAFARHWHDAVGNGNDFYLLTHLDGEGETFRVLGRAVFFPDGNMLGNTSLAAADAGYLKPELHNISATAVLPLKDTRVMVDRMRKARTLYCFGAGHVAVPTAHLAALVGFRVVVLDDRAEFANAERFPEAQETKVLADFNRALAGLDIDKDSFIVIVTRGHQYDRVVLEQSLKTKAGYIGMISSKRKRDAIYEALAAEGVPKEQLDGVHSPIGIGIGGETPEEIAVSIVAELIQVRSRQTA
ncbi:MAG: XdhC family aldehyde oxidoreductase maturation factor [Dehalococcoidales bacterium]|jgi:xanthine dehydrogenase accessory factor